MAYRLRSGWRGYCLLMYGNLILALAMPVLFLFLLLEVALLALAYLELRLIEAHNPPAVGVIPLNEHEPSPGQPAHATPLLVAFAAASG